MPFTDLGVSHEIKEESFDKTRKSYPCTYITSKEPIDFGASGTAEIRYKLVEKAEKERNDEKEYRYEIEIHGVAPIDSEEMDEEEPRKGLTQNFGEMLDRARKGRDSDDE